MFYLVMVFSLGMVVSLLWFLAAALRTLVAARRDATSFRAGTVMHRTLLMTVVFGVIGGLMHAGVVHSDSFRAGVPAGLLTMDAKHPFYGRLALIEMTRRVMAGQIRSEQCSSLTEVVLAHLWWVNDTPNGLVNSAAGSVSGGLDPGREWLATMQERDWLTGDQFARWLTIDPPPLFTAIEQDGETAIRYEYGRDWTYEHNLPYEIARVQIDAVRAGGVPVDSFTVNEISEGEGDRGFLASHAIFHITDLAVAAESGTPGAPIEVEYTLDLEPGNYTEIGPLIWSDR